METFQPIPRAASRDRRKENLGGYDCELVDVPPTHMQTECSVCLQILKEPCLISCCGHKFCRECIGRVQRDGKGCPLCNAPEFSFMREHALERTLKELNVFCSHKTEGCEWKGKLTELDKHVNRLYSHENQLRGCQFTEIECAYQCGEWFQRCHITTHQTDQCNKRAYSCDYCGDYSSTFEDVTSSHYPQCSKYPVACPNDCSVYKFERQSIEQHLQDECLLAVVNCPFRYAGCEVVLPRKDMPEHTQNTLVHLMVLGSFTQKLARENQELRLHAKEAEKKHNFLRDKVSKLSSTCYASHHFIQHNKMQGCECESFSVTEYGDSSNSVSELELRNGYFPVFPFVFTLKNFLGFKNMIGKVCEYSPEFYSHSRGYKMRVVVHRNQYSRALSFDPFCSIYVEIMQGPFDEMLKWPFKGSVTIRILNQLNDCNHCEKTICFNDNAYQSIITKPDSNRFQAYGYKEFIYHKELDHNPEKQTHYM